MMDVASVAEDDDLAKGCLLIYAQIAHGLYLNAVIRHTLHYAAAASWVKKVEQSCSFPTDSC